MTPEPDDRPVEKRVEELETRMRQLATLTTNQLSAASRAPTIEVARGEALLPKIAILMTRIRTVEERFDELSEIVVNLFDVVRDLLRERGR